MKEEARPETARIVAKMTIVRLFLNANLSPLVALVPAKIGFRWTQTELKLLILNQLH